VGEPGSPDHRGKVADPDRQPFQGNAGAVTPAAKSARARSDAARPARHQGPGKRQTRARDRGGRRASSADDRLARRRQVDAGGAAALDPAAAVAVGTAGSLDDRFRCRRNPRRRADGATAVPQPPSFRQHGSADRRRHPRQARRNFAGTSGRAVPRRTAGVRSARAGFAAPAAGERRGRGEQSQPPCHLSRALHAGCRNEPMPLRMRPAIPASAGGSTAAPRTIRCASRAR
jgi:hypothetical protein